MNKKQRTAKQIKSDICALEKRLREYLKDKDRSEIAEQTGTYKEHISGFKGGSLHFGTDKLLLICEKLGL